MSVVKAAQVGHIVEKPEARAKEGGRHRKEGEGFQHTQDKAAVDARSRGADEIADVPARRDDALELLAGDDAVGGHDPRHIAGQGDKRPVDEAFVDAHGLLAEILDQTGHRSVEAEGGQVGGKRAPYEDGPVAVRARAAGGGQEGQAYLRKHPGHGEHEGEDHCGHEDHGQPIHETGAPPHAGDEDKGEAEPGNEAARPSESAGPWNRPR